MAKHDPKQDKREQPGRQPIPEHEPTPADPGAEGPRKEWAPGRRPEDDAEARRMDPNDPDAEREPRGPGRTARDHGEVDERATKPNGRTRRRA
jgi:hypothetical protein